MILRTGLTCGVLQVDLISFQGPLFEHVDNRVAALRLVQKGLCDAALFDPSGTSCHFGYNRCIIFDWITCHANSLYHFDAVMSLKDAGLSLRRRVADPAGDAVQEKCSAGPRPLPPLHTAPQ